MDAGKRIKQLREEKHFTQEQLAKRINSTKQAIFKYENCVVTNIPLDKVTKIAKVLGCSPAYLIGWDNNANSGINNGIIGNQNSNNIIGNPNYTDDPIESAILTIVKNLTQLQKGEVLSFAIKLISNKGE